MAIHLSLPAVCQNNAFGVYPSKNTADVVALTFDGLAIVKQGVA